MWSASYSFAFKTTLLLINLIHLDTQVQLEYYQQQAPRNQPLSKHQTCFYQAQIHSLLCCFISTPSCFISTPSLSLVFDPSCLFNSTGTAAGKSNKPVHKIKMSYLPVSCLQLIANWLRKQRVSPAVGTPSFSSLLCHGLAVTLTTFLFLLSREHFYGQFGEKAHLFYY